MSPYWIHFLALLSLLGSAIHWLTWHCSVRRAFMAEKEFVSYKRKIQGYKLVGQREESSLNLKKKLKH